MSLRHSLQLYQDRGHNITVQPSIEPVSLEEVKIQLKITESDEDIFLVGAIEEAREEIEHLADLALITQTWKLALDHWPAGRQQWWDGVREGAITDIFLNNRQLRVELPRYPAQSVTSVTTYADDSTPTVVTVADVFDLDFQRKPARMALKSGAVWPTAMRDINAIEIVYVAGYGDTVFEVPRPLKRAIRNTVAYLYNHRGDGCDMEDAIAASGALTTIQRYKTLRV